MSLASGRWSPCNSNEWLADTSRTLPNEDEPLISPNPSRENTSVHGHPSQHNILSLQAAVFSVDAFQAVPPPVSLLHIPPELIIRILLYLSPHDIISCGRTCRMLHDLCSYPDLRYLVQMECCAVTDDLRPGIGFLERLRILENREEAWATLDFRRSVQVSVPFNSTSTYDFTGGALLLGTRPSHADDQSTVGYSHISLPSLSDSQDQKLEWKEFSLGTEILDFALAAHEVDLVAVLTATADVRRPSDMILEIRLLSPSTGQPHPLAEQPIIFIGTKSMPLGIDGVHIEIVGEFLIYLITFEEWVENENIFSLVRWKKGEVHFLQSWEWGTCVYFSFLSQDTLVIPNLTLNTLGVSKIIIDSDDTPRLVPLCILHLPPLAQDTLIYNLYCRAAPNPTSSDPVSISSLSHRPFRDKAEDAIIIFDILYGHSSGSDWLTFTVHRSALLAHVPVAHRACAAFCPAPEASTLDIVHVPWPEWGPAATRWFKEECTSMSWITRTAGQRAVTLRDSMPSPIIVRDFNPYAVRAACAQASASGKTQHGNWSMQLPNGNWKTLNVMESVLDAGPTFEEDVRSSLPYVEIVTQNKYHYDGVMIDDQRILGFKSNQGDAAGTWSFDVHVLG